MATAVEFIVDMLGSELFLKGAGGAAFALHNADTWQWWHYIAWFAIILLGMEILSQLVLLFGKYVHGSDLIFKVHLGNTLLSQIVRFSPNLSPCLVAGSGRVNIFPTVGSIWTSSNRWTSRSSRLTGLVSVNSWFVQFASQSDSIAMHLESGSPIL